MFTKRTLATGLRVWTLATRFLLVFFLAKFLPAAEVGMYGLLVATISYIVYIMGIDLYTYTTREVLKSDSANWGGQISNHFHLLGYVYAITLPLLSILFVVGILPWSMAIWFYLIAITEHLGLEVDRLLIAMSDQLRASIVIFVRQALLPTLIIPIFIFFSEARSLELVLACWAGFNLAAVILGGTVILRRVSGAVRLSPDWKWIRKGLKVSWLFFLGTLLLRFLFTADRQVIAVFGDLEMLGAYTFAMSIGTGLSSVLAVAVHQFSYPKLVMAAGKRDWASYRRELFRMSTQTLLITIAIAVGVIVFDNLIIQWVGGGIYEEYRWLLLAAVLVMGLYNLSLVAHYALYALHADRAILLTTFISLLAFALTISVVLTTGAGPVIAVLSGLAVASALLLTTKSAVYFKVRNIHR